MSWVNRNRQWRERAEANWLPRHPEPIRVRGWFSSPVAWDGYDPLMLEGALQYAVVVRETGRAPDDVYSDCPLSCPLSDAGIQIPISDQLVGGSEFPIAMASGAWFSPDATPTVRWRRRRLRAEYYARATVKAAQGDTKACNLPSATVTALFADWYVCGDRERMTELLQDVTHIGGHRGGGLGLMKGWEVEGTDRAWWFFGPGGRLMRTMPLADGEPTPPLSDPRESTLRAPYWHPRTRCLCAVPAQRLGEPIEAVQ